MKAVKWFLCVICGTFLISYVCAVATNNEEFIDDNQSTTFISIDSIKKIVSSKKYDLTRIFSHESTTNTKDDISFNAQELPKLTTKSIISSELETSYSSSAEESSTEEFSSTDINTSDVPTEATTIECTTKKENFEHSSASAHTIASSIFHNVQNHLATIHSTAAIEIPPINTLTQESTKSALEEIQDEIDFRGNFGRLHIDDVEIDVAVFYTQELDKLQKYVDGYDSACMFSWVNNTTIIADHSYQAFGSLKHSTIGMRAEIISYSMTQHYNYITTLYNITNTGNDLIYPDGSSIFVDLNGYLLIYTCEIDGTIIVTIWK